MTPDEIRSILDRNQRCWTPEAREAMQRDIAERQQRIATERLWTTPEPDSVPAADRLAREGWQQRQQASKPAPSWGRWVRDETKAAIRKRETALLAGIGDVLAEERRRTDQAVAELQRENERADELIEALQKQVAELTERLAKLETASERPVPLRAVG